MSCELQLVLSCTVFSLQWIISEYACYTYSMVAVPLYDTLGPDAIVYIVNKGKYQLTLFHNDFSKKLCFEKAEVQEDLCKNQNSFNLTPLTLL